MKFFSTEGHNPKSELKQFLKYVGPGLMVTVGFIDPGNWASNIAAGSEFGYKLLWMVTLSTLMLIMLQHNAAHLGIVTGDCLSESAHKHLPKKASVPILLSAMLAAVATALAEILGGAIALKMLFRIPLKIGSVMILALVLFLLFSNNYRKLEKIIVGFVSLIGLAFLAELLLVKIDWIDASLSWVLPSMPMGSLPVIMSVLGAVVMPHNLFLHSEIIQSREFNKQDKSVIETQLKYEFLDTMLSMIIGWAINSAMIIMAAASFFSNGIHVTELEQAQTMLIPLLGQGAAIIFALALLFAGVSSSVTAAMAAGSIFAGMYAEPLDLKDRHSKVAVFSVLALATVLIFFISNPFQGLVYSQMLLSIQLPITVFLQIYLTGNEKIMGEYKNTKAEKILLYLIAAVITVLNIMLLWSFL